MGQVRLREPPELCGQLGGLLRGDVQSENLDRDRS
jgi:hypothetical protein